MKTNRLLVVTFLLGLMALGLCCLPSPVRKEVEKPASIQPNGYKPTENPKHVWPAGHKPIEITTILGDVKFGVPSKWLEPQSHLYLSKKELDSVKDGDSEWDYEYAAIVNRIVPFDACVVHVGSEWWGSRGCSFADIQLRIYAIKSAPQQIEAKVLSLADIEPKVLFSGRKNYRPHGMAVGYSPKFTIKRGSSRPWRKTTVEHRVRYGDYGGTSRVDLRMKQFDGYCLVFAFMYVPGRHVKDSLFSNVLGSVSVQRK